MSTTSTRTSLVDTETAPSPEEWANEVEALGGHLLYDDIDGQPMIDSDCCVACERAADTMARRDRKRQR